MWRSLKFVAGRVSWPTRHEALIDAGLVLACVAVAVFGVVVAGWFHQAFAG